MNEKLMKNEMSNVELDKVSGGQMSEDELKKCNDFIAKLDPTLQEKAKVLFSTICLGDDVDFTDFSNNWNLYLKLNNLVQKG